MSWMDDEPVRGGYPPLPLLGLPGDARMNAGRDGLMLPPPIHHLFGLTPVETNVGSSTFSMPASPWLQTGVGVFLAGVSALVADAPLGSAILSRVPAGVFGVTSELSLSYLRPASVQSGTLFAHAQVIDLGSSQGLSQAIVEDESGRLLAHSTSRYFLTRIDPPPDPSVLEKVEFPVYDTPDPYQRPAPALSPSSDWIDMTSLEVFRAVSSGKVARAPVDELFGLEWIDPQEGSIGIRVRAREWLNSPAHTIYGGIIAFLADAAITAAVSTTLPARASCAILDLKVHFLRPGIADGREIITRAQVSHRGRTLAVARAEMENADGKRIATASGSAMVLDRPWAPVAVADEQAPTQDS